METTVRMEKQLQVEKVVLVLELVLPIGDDLLSRRPSHCGCPMVNRHHTHELDKVGSEQLLLKRVQKPS